MPLFGPLVRPLAPLAVVASALVGCGGGGGGGGFTSDDAPGARTEPWRADGANGALTGRAWSPRIPGFLELDTGRTVTLADGPVHPRRDGAEFVEVSDSVRFIPDPGCSGDTWYTHTDRITVRDAATGVATAGFSVVEDVYGAPKLSPDGTRIAARWVNATVCREDEATLTVFDREGNIVIRGRPGLRDFAWLPDNRLVFTVDDSSIAVEAERDTLRYDTIADLSDVPGDPFALEVSPDGEHVLFEMVTDGPILFSGLDYRDATVWHVGVDGSNLGPLIDTSRALEYNGPRVNAPAFSPDGRTLLVTEDYIGGGAVTLYGQEGPEFPIITGVDYVPVTSGWATHAVPVSMLPVELPPPAWTADGVRPIFERDADGASSLARLWPLEGRAWTDAPARAQPSAGELPGPNGRPHRGIEGHVYRLDNYGVEVPALQRLDLATGTTVSLSVPDGLDVADASYLAVASDESLIAVVERDYTDSTLWVLDAGGGYVADYRLATDSYHHLPESPPVFAPDGSPLLAWAYDDGDFSNGVVVLDVVTADFVATFDERYWDTVAWFPNGDLLLVDAGELWRAARTADGFADPVLLGDTHDTVRHPRVHPDGDRIVFAGGHQIMMLALDTGITHRVTAWTDSAETSPQFSPDGRWILFRKLGDFEFGYPWIVSSEARDVRVHEPGTTAAAMRVGENADIDWRVTDGETPWR